MQGYSNNSKDVTLCKYCGKAFFASRLNQEYHSASCKNAAYRKRKNQRDLVARKSYSDEEADTLQRIGVLTGTGDDCFVASWLLQFTPRKHWQVVLECLEHDLNVASQRAFAIGATPPWSSGNVKED